MNTPPCYDVIVIGAGIIGISSALALQSAGQQVLVVDGQGVAQGASCGNAGAFAFADIVPLATPGIMAKAPKWLLDPLGPLSIPPAYALRILPWMLKFWRASWRDRYTAAIAAQANLMHFSQAALQRQVQAVQGEFLLRREGQLQVYEGAHEFAASLPGWATRKAHGVAVELLESPAAIARIQPGIHPRFSHAGFTPEWLNTCDPARWTQYLADCFLQGGGQLNRLSVERLQLTDGGVELIHRQGALQARNVVIAAGAWSKPLARSLGDNLPLETERGYNTTLPNPDFPLQTHLTFTNHGFVVSRIGAGIRVGGAVELGGLQLKPNYRRATVLLDKATRFLPGLNPAGGEQWMGFRPSMPDSLPVISRSAASANVVYAFGHGHLGLTQSAGTAELVAALLSDTPPPIDLAPYAASRFR